MCFNLSSYIFKCLLFLCKIVKIPIFWGVGLIFLAYLKKILGLKYYSSPLLEITEEYLGLFWLSQKYFYGNKTIVVFISVNTTIWLLNYLLTMPMPTVLMCLWILRNLCFTSLQFECDSYYFVSYQSTISYNVYCIYNIDYF